MNIFKKKPSVPHEATADKIIPLHFFDDNPLFTRVTLYNLKVFNDVLDPEKLLDGLERLVQRPTWQKLSGRIRRGVKHPLTSRCGCS